jgi:site-specific DNA recombinase
MMCKSEVLAMTAVIYARYSTDSQREESIEGQIRECTAYAEKNGFTVVKHYIDRAVSAKTDNRPQFQQMIKDSERGIFDVIIVWKLDRFARNRYDSARYKTQLKRNGVKLVSATEVISAGYFFNQVRIEVIQRSSNRFHDGSFIVTIIYWHSSFLLIR